MKKLSINKNDLFDVIKATILGVIFSLILVLIFSLIVNLTNVNDKVITIVNQVIKLISIFLSCALGIKIPHKGALKGGCVGLLYTFLGIFVFGIISRSVSFNAMKLLDIVIGILMGGISGILTVNFRKK